MEEMIYDELDDLGIHELRTLARTVGVKSPTSKKRQVLMDEIRKIKSGQARPQFNSHFGRPVKNHGNQDVLISKLMVGADEELENKFETELVEQPGIICFEQNLKDFDAPTSFNLIDVCGVVRKTQKNSYYFLNNKKISKKIYVLIEDIDVNKYNIMEGDLIEGYAYLNPKTNFAKLKNITLIDDISPENNTFDLDRDFVLPQNVIDSNGLKLGQSTLSCTQNRDFSIAFIQDKVKSLKIENVKYVVLGLDISIETKLKLDKIPNLIQITSMNDEVASFSKETLLDALNLVNSLYYHGYNVVLFVLNTLHIFDILDTAFNIKNKAHNESIEYLVKKTLSQCKASENASITVYGLYYNDQIHDYENEIKTLEKIINS